MDGTELTVAGVTFVCGVGRRPTATRFSIQKTTGLVDKYLELAPRYVGANIVELGIAAGGSTALLALLTEPRKLVACELAPARIQALDELIDSRGLHASTHFEVDQADTAPQRRKPGGHCISSRWNSSSGAVVGAMSLP